MVMPWYPLNYNELIRIAQNKLEICALPDMQVLRKCDLSQYENIILLNVDPYSHILAIGSTNYIVLIDIKHDAGSLQNKNNLRMG